MISVKSSEIISVEAIEFSVNIPDYMYNPYEYRGGLKLFGIEIVPPYFINRRTNEEALPGYTDDNFYLSSSNKCVYVRPHVRIRMADGSHHLIFFNGDEEARKYSRKLSKKLKLIEL